MEISIFDVILLFILSIAVSMIVGYNIIYIIDKKISSVNINIPPVYVPKPVVNIKINKKDNNKFDIQVEKEIINEEINQEVVNEKISNAKLQVEQKNELVVNNNIENFRNILKNKRNTTQIEIPEMDNVEAFGSYASFKKKN